MRLDTPGATKVAGLVGLLVLAALGWLLVVGPQTARLGEVREEITTVEDQNMLLAAQLAQLQQQREELPATRRTARLLAAKFPPTADQPGLFEAVTAAAVEAGIGADGVTTLAPTPPTVEAAEPAAGTTSGDTTTGDATGAAGAAGGGVLARQTVTVTVSGTFDQTQRLLENLEQMSRAYLVTAVSLAGDPGTSSFTTTVTGEMFVMPPVPSPAKTVNLSSTTEPEE